MSYRTKYSLIGHRLFLTGFHYLDEADLIILVSEGDPGLSGLVGADLGQIVPF